MLARVMVLVLCARGLAFADVAEPTDAGPVDPYATPKPPGANEPPPPPPVAPSAKATINPLPAEKPAPNCGRRWYAEPSMLGGYAGRMKGPFFDAYIVMHRVAFGARIRHCTETELHPIEGRLGTTAIITTGRLIGGGFGVEGELDFPTKDWLLIGPRLSIELNDSMQIVTLGARFRFFDAVAAGLDGFYLRHSNDTQQSAGGMFSLSLDGQPGVLVGAVEGTVLSIGLTLLVVALISDGGSL